MGVESEAYGYKACDVQCYDNCQGFRTSTSRHNLVLTAKQRVNPDAKVSINVIQPRPTYIKLCQKEPQRILFKKKENYLAGCYSFRRLRITLAIVQAMLNIDTRARRLPLCVKTKLPSRY